MYTAKLFDELFSSNPVTIIDDRKSKTLLEALQRAVNTSDDFNVPGIDPIVRIDMYDGVHEVSFRKSIHRTDNYRSIVALTHEYVYNAWIQGNKLYFYILSNDKKSDVLHHFTACTENGKIKLMLGDAVLTLDSYDELINTAKYTFPDDVHNVMTILETLFYVE